MSRECNHLLWVAQPTEKTRRELTVINCKTFYITYTILSEKFAYAKYQDSIKPKKRVSLF